MSMADEITVDWRLRQHADENWCRGSRGLMRNQVNRHAAELWTYCRHNYLNPHVRECDAICFGHYLVLGLWVTVGAPPARDGASLQTARDTRARPA